MIKNIIKRVIAPLQKHPVLLTLSIIWVVASCIGIYWAKQSYLAPHENYFAYFQHSNIKDIPATVSKGQITVVHLIDNECPCSRFSEPHIKTLESQFEQDTTFYRWPNLPQAIHSALAENTIPASPAVAIWSQEGKLSYFGPYSSGVFCGEGEDFVERILVELNNGHEIRLVNHDALGCFCPWRH